MAKEKIDISPFSANPNELKNERKMIGAMSYNDKELFVDKLFLARESEIYAHSESANIIGLAIDPITMEYCVTEDDQQELAKQSLTYRVRNLQEKLEGKMMDMDQEGEVHRRIISGFIIPGVNGLSSPIFVMRTDFNKDRYSDFANFLKQQDFIAITEYGTLIE